MDAIYYLGVDGGGTSTTAALADERGTIMGTGTAGPSLYKVVGLAGAVKNIRQAVMEAERRARVRPRPYAYAVFGLSGVDSMKDWKILSALLYRELRPMARDQFRVVNDVVIALAAGTTKPYGAAVIAGTGSNAYAVGRHGEEAYAGGLGTVLADEGSAYAIGSAMLRAAVRSFDGRIRKTLLERGVARALGVRHMRDAVDVVYQPEFNKTVIAGLAPLCTRLARRGDRAARDIIIHAAEDLASMVCAVITRARLTQAAFDLVLAGNVFRAGPLFLDPFARTVRHAAPHVSVVRLRHRAVKGAVRLAHLYEKRQ